MKSKHIQKILLLVAITILLVGLASATTTNKTNTNKNTKTIKDNTKTIKDNTKTIKTTPAATKKAATKTVTNNKTLNKLKDKTSEKKTQKIEKNKQKNIKTETETICVKNWTNLTDEIGKVTSDTTIKLEEGSYNTTDTITWNKPYTLTIDGNGQTINGTQKRVFFIEKGSALVLKNITITNAQTTGINASGGAIYNNEGNLTIIHSTLKNNTVTTTGEEVDDYAYGGAIYNNKGNLTITHSTLKNNIATVTTTNKHSFAHGGAIHSNNGTLNITYTILEGNTARATTTNTATGDHGNAFAMGGAISNFHGGTINITYSTLENNTATGTGTGQYIYNYAIGGAIFIAVGNITIINTTLTNNTATANSQALGGAIRLEYGNLTIINTTLTNNTATATGNYNFVYGGAIYNSGTLTINNSTLNNNKITATTTGTDANAYTYGGAISNTGTLTINNSTLNNNKITATTTGNYANAHGGAISNTGNLTITYSTLNNNLATATAKSIDENNKAYAHGGAISNTGNLTITYSTLNNNLATATTRGENYAEANEMIIYNLGNHFNITDTTFYKNTPANFIINETSKNIQLVNDDEYISIVNFSIIADGKEIGTGNNEEDLKSFTISDEYKNVEIIINGTDDQTLNNRYMLRGFSIDVHNYTELVNAIKKAQSENYDSYIINLQPGDYNATSTISWIVSKTKTLIIDGNNITLDGKHEHQFIRIGRGLNLTLNNITITNYNVTGQNTYAYGGAIYNNGTLTITHSTLSNNKAIGTEARGGAIYSHSGCVNITNCNFTNNYASNGGAIFSDGHVNITKTIFAYNTADNKETIVLEDVQSKLLNDNIYQFTDISLNLIELSVKNNMKSFYYGDKVVLNYTIVLEHPNYYDQDILERIEDITIYINDEKYDTTKNENYTLSNLKPGTYTVYYKTSNQKSNNVTFTMTLYNSEISTSEDFYDYYEGIENKVTININDYYGKNGTINVSVKKGNEYHNLLIYHNIKEEYTLTTKTIADALKKHYSNLDDSYIINVTYTSDYVIPSSTEFTLKIIKQRNTSIIYNILNNTEGNVQINITVIDTITKTPISNAKIKITGAINKNTTSGIINDKTLKSGNYKITVNYEKTEQYLNSTAIINFKVEMDKDNKIKEQDNNIKQLENKVEKLTQKTKTKITINTAKATIGKKVTIKITVKDANNKAVTGGKISLKVNGKLLKDSNNNIIYADVTGGVASIKYLVPGSWITKNPKIQAIYTGNDKYNDSTITKTGLIKVQKGSTTITLTPNIKNLKAGQKVTINVKHIDTNTKQGLTSKVAVKVNGKTYKVKVKNGEGKLTYTIPKGMNAKTVKVTASHSSKYYNKATSKTTFKVTKTTPTIKTTKTTTKAKKTTIKGKILDANNKVLTKNVKVTVKVNGKVVLKNKVVKKGKINLSFKKSLKKGYHELTITSKATKAFNKGKLTTVLKI